MSKKIAILHAFFKHDCKGGAEKLVFDIRDYYRADLFAGAISSEVWGIQNKNTDAFAARLWDDRFKFKYLHEDSKIPIWMQLKRQLYFAFSPKINELKKYDIVIFSGNIGFVPTRLRFSKVKKVIYCYTPPRKITDQLEIKLKSKPFFLRPVLWILAKFALFLYKVDMSSMDLVLSISENSRKRLKKYLGLDSMPIFPAVNTDKFQWKGQGDYYLSYARLEEIKRIPLILNTFAEMPDKKLIIVSSGPLKDWVKEQISTRNLKNIIYQGIVSDAKLAELVGNCIAGIYIPIDEDAGMTQCELMAAGKPVIGVQDGGLLETVIDGQTGILLPKEPTKQDLMSAITKLNAEQALAMKEKCYEQGLNFRSEVFFEKLNSQFEKLFT